MVHGSLISHTKKISNDVKRQLVCVHYVQPLETRCLSIDENNPPTEEPRPGIEPLSAGSRSSPPEPTDGNKPRSVTWRLILILIPCLPAVSPS